MAHEDVDALLDFLDKAPAARVAHPRTEHFAPLFVSLGAAYGRRRRRLRQPERHRRVLVRPLEAVLAARLSHSRATRTRSFGPTATGAPSLGP